MPYEKFDPASACNPPLPLNAITNKLTFFRINVFDARLDLLAHQSDGRIDPDLDYVRMRTGGYRLGLPLTDLFPEIRKRLRTRFVKDGLPQPVKVGIEGVYLPSDRGDPEEPEITDVRVTDDDLKKPELTIGDLTINPRDILGDVKSRGHALIKQGKTLYRITRAVPGGSRSAATGSGSQRRSLAYDFTVTFPFDPATLNDDLYFEVLGDLLFDPRSGMSEKGVDSASINCGALNDAHYGLAVTNYRKDPRYKRYFTKHYPSANAKPGVVKLPSYEIGMYSTYEQTWELLGYSRGALLESITLAPKEEVSIEVFTFDRIKLEQEKELTSEFEQNLEVTTFARASAEVSRDLTTTTDVNADVGLGIPLPTEGIPVSLDVGGGVSNQVKEGLQQSVNHLHEVTLNRSEKLKSKTRVKIVQTRETGEERRTIRKIVNPNASKTLTLNYFELLETYKVTTALKSTKRFCLLMDAPDFGALNLDFVLAYEDRLQKALLSTNFVGGFEGARKLAAQRWFERKSELKEEIEHTNQQNAGADPAQPQAPEKPVITIGTSLRKKLDKFLKVDLLKAAEILNRHYDPFASADDKPSQKEVSDAENTFGLFNFWFKFKLASPGVESKAFEYVEATSGSPSESAIVGALGLFLTGMDDEWLTSVKMVALNLVSIQLASLVVIFFPLLAAVLYELALLDNNDGLPALIDKAKKELKSYEVATSATVAPPTTAGSASAAPPPQPEPPQLFALDELAFANAEFEKLVLHLEANKTYYINKLLLYEDSNQRYERLKIKGVAPYVENRLLGFVGNKSVYPLKLQALSTATQSRLLNELANFDPARDENLNGTASAKITSPPAENISLPTSGVYVESMLGRCDALEPYLLDRRLIEQQIVQAQADLAVEKVAQQKEENRRLSERIRQNLLDNPF